MEKTREGEKGKYERKRRTYKENNFNFKYVCVFVRMCMHLMSSTYICKDSQQSCVFHSELRLS